MKLLTRLIATCFVLFNQMNGSFAQKEIASLDINSSAVFGMSTFVSKDTVLISFKDQFDSQFTRLIQVFPDGSYKSIYAQDVLGAEFCGFETSRGVSYYYFRENLTGRKFKLGAIIIDNNNKDRQILRGKVVIDDPIIGMVNDESGLIFIARNVNRNSVSRIKISRYQVMDSDEFQLTEPFSLKYANEFDLIQDNITGWIDDAPKRAKIYISNFSLRLSLDDARKKVTIIDTFNGNDKTVSSITIPCLPGKDFSSFASDSTLFTVSTTSKVFSIATHDILNGRLKGQKNVYVDSVGRAEVFFSSANKGKVLKTKSSSGSIKGIVIASRAKPAIVAQKVSINKFNIVWGTLSYESPHFIGIPGTPTASLSLLNLAYINRRNTQESNYLHSTFDGRNFDLTKDDNLVFKRIDNLEVTFQERGMTIVDYLIRDQKNAFVFAKDIKSKRIVIFKFD